MENLLTSSTPSPVTLQGGEDQEKKDPAPTLDCSLINGEQSTIIPDSPSRGDSLFVNSGSMGDTEETLLQTPAPLKDYSNVKITGTYMSRSQTPGIAYRLRSRTKELTKPQHMINDLIKLVKEDIKDDESWIKSRLERDDSEVYSLVGDEEEEHGYVSYSGKNKEEIETDIKRRVQFKEVMESLDTSIGAVVKVKCLEEQEEKLEIFKEATEALTQHVKKVKDKGDWKLEECSVSPGETEETSTIKSLTFTVDGGQCLTMKKIIPVFERLSDLDLEDLPIEYLIIVIRTLLSICKQESETQIAGEQVVKRLEIAICSLATTYELLAEMEKTIIKLRENMQELKQEKLKRQKTDKKEIESLRKEKEEQVESVNNIRLEMYKMGDAAKKDRKKASDEISRLRIENNTWKIDAKEKGSSAARFERKLIAMEKENNDLKERLIDQQGEETTNNNEELNRLNQENSKLKTEAENYKKEFKKKDDSIKALKEENKAYKKEEERLWQRHDDNVDKLSELSDMIAEKEEKLLEADDLIYKTNDEITEEKLAKNTAEEEMRKLKKDYEKIQRKYLSLKKSSSEKDLEIKKKDMEIARYKSQKPKDTPEEERTPKKAVRRNPQANPPQCGPPQCGKSEKIHRSVVYRSVAP